MVIPQRNFPDPFSFNPSRFIDKTSGGFRPQPALVPFGLGKRDCLGKTLARAEIFLFASHLLHQFSFHPASSGAPSVDEGDVGVTRAPKPFKVVVRSR